MAKTRIGGVTVARGGRVKWGLVGSILVGAPLYAYYEGAIALLYGVRDFLLSDVLGGVRTFLVTLIDLEFTIASVASRSAWWEFAASVRDSGPFTYVLSVAAVGVVLLLFFVLVRKGVDALAG